MTSPLPVAGRYPPARKIPARKIPALHAAASLVIPGLGTFLCGKWVRAALILGLSVLSLFGVNALANAVIGGEPTGIGTLLAVPLWVWGMIDGYRSAQRWNLEHPVRPVPGVGESERLASPAGRTGWTPGFVGLDLPGGDDPSRARVGAVTGSDQLRPADICRRDGHDEEFQGYGGSGMHFVCRRCGHERDEYEGSVPD